jgi:hypothetical protein
LAPIPSRTNSSAQQYFPPGVLGPDPQSHEFKADWYSKQLKALHEPSLWELSQTAPNAEVYRFLWLRSFHHPIAIRVVVRASGSSRINSRMTSGTGGLEPGGIRRYSTSWLRKALTEELLTAFANADFWNLPTLLDVNCAPQVDGAQWIFEGARNGKYHVIDRWSPNGGDPARAIGIAALRMARFKIRSAEIY